MVCWISTSQLDVALYLKVKDICGHDHKAGDTTGGYFSGFHTSLLMLRSSASQHNLRKKPLGFFHDPLKMLHAHLTACVQVCQCQGTR